MTADELGRLKDILVKNGVVAATASDGDVSAAHGALLSGPNSTEYRATLVAGGVPVEPNWLTIIGVLGGAVAIYFIWKHYKTDKIETMNRPDPEQQRHQLRGMSRALGSFTRMGSSRGCANPRVGRMGRFGAAEKYEFEPERRLEGYGRKARRK